MPKRFSKLNKIFPVVSKFSVMVYKTIRELLILWLLFNALRLLPIVNFNEHIAYIFNRAWVQEQLEQGPSKVEIPDPGKQ